MNLQRSLKEKLRKLLSTPDSVIVLQGLPLDVLPENLASVCAAIDWPTLLQNPMMYLYQEVVQKERRVLLIEEYRLLKSFLRQQFREIIILRNNLYLDAYPVAAVWPENVRTALLAHFDEEAGEDADIGAAGRAIEIYGKVFSFKHRLFAMYSEEEASTQVFIEDLFEETAADLPERETMSVRNLREETDFLALVLNLTEGDVPEQELALRIADYVGGKERLRAHLRLLAELAGARLILAEEPALPEVFEHRPIYTELLKRYWHHDTFRTFRVYDLAALQKGQKRTREVSQEAVISRIVQEVEASGRGEQPRDVFVTAPTGAGKSAMFQIPAMVLAQGEQPLMTLVISPLIGLMNDQVQGLEGRDYGGAKTINSDISPVVKQDIMEKVGKGDYHILYLSPETLLARSDVEQLIGDRTIGMIVVDEAHIVTTWGKQFRPDYWYLGNHIRKLRKNQIQKKNRDFVIATFTATAIYGGREDMYEETITSLHMVEPVTYLGYVRRDEDIHIEIQPMEIEERSEYELDKFRRLEELIDGAMLMERKTLIYFPTVRLIRSFYDYLGTRRKRQDVVTYYGTMDRLEKQESYEAFRTGKKPVMLATKAFGMGIDIDDIENIIHFAPTGNVCDYVQEIGRAARRKDLEGDAIYPYHRMDFRHINRLQGMSAIRTGQLIGVIKKLLSTYKAQLRGQRTQQTKKRNAMLIDADNFAYLFNRMTSDQDDAIAKVKTALLLIQKDFERWRGYSPIAVRPIPLFGRGYFAIAPQVQRALRHAYHDTVRELDDVHHVCSVELENIWKESYREMSFPMFKYLVYSHDEKLYFNQSYALQPALYVSLTFANGGEGEFWKVWRPLKDFVHRSVSLGRYRGTVELADVLSTHGGLKHFEAEAFVDVLLSSMDVYASHFSHSIQSGTFRMMTLRNGEKKYLFSRSVQNYFAWVEHWFHEIKDEAQGGKLYLVQDAKGGRLRAASLVLGLLEAMNVLNFEMMGGENSKLFIYMYQTEPLESIVRHPKEYHNRLLDEIYARHKLSVAMLTFLYESDLPSERIWDYLEDYFLGRVPEEVQQAASEKGDQL